MLELPYSISIVTTLLAAVAGFFYGRSLHRRGFEITAHINVADCPLIPVALLLFVVLHVTTGTVTGDPNIGWALPVTFEYYLPGMMWVFKTAFAAFALAAVPAVAYFQRTRAWIPIALFSIAALCLMDGLTRLAVQPYVGDLRHEVKNGVIIQTHPSTCAAASVANVARILGIPADEASMVDLLNTTWAGTSPAQMVFGLRRLGLNAEKTYSPERDITTVRPPAILLVAIGNEPDAHAVAYVGPRRNRFEIWDPGGAGRIFKTSDELRTWWHGRAIEVTTPDQQ